MSCPQTCSIHRSGDPEAAEAAGYEALAGRLSWRKAAASVGLRDTALKRHMQEHVVAPVVAEARQKADDELQAMIDDAMEGLKSQFALATDDVRPLILVAMRNLEGLRDMKPSQEQLIRSLKTIQEMTGMKNEQKMLLAFAEAKFGKSAPALRVPSERKALTT